MDELEIIRQELKKHYGKGHEISAGEIEEMLGYQTEGSHHKGRTLILKCAEVYNIPLGSNSNGYYIMTTPEELAENGATLDSRIAGIEAHKLLMEKNFKEWHK